MATYGRHRQSIADIENELQNIFNQHPDSQVNDSGEPVIPADALVDVFRSFSEVYDGVQLLSEEEMEMLKALLASNPGLEVTPQILLQFIAEKTKHSPPRSPSVEEDAQLPERGRADERDNSAQRRSPSTDSEWSAYNSDWKSYKRESSSRASSRGPPQTPSHGKSPFDAERRQRSTPLSSNAPSSWAKRPAPAHRRKSDAGSRSGSESTSPNSWSRGPGRIRTPSNPTSPSSSIMDLNSFSPFGSPTFSGLSRPHSRARSQPQSSIESTFAQFGSPGDDRGYSSPDDGNTIHGLDRSLYDYHNDDSFLGSISSLPMPHSMPDDDDDDLDSSDLVLDRMPTSSTVSMEPMERLDALQRVNADLGRKLMEAERTLQNKLSEHEFELEEMQSRLEEMRSELSATKREEKELRSKERQNIAQINSLEAEINKVQKNLENSRATYTSLQRQYQEQCAASEKYRDDLRQREELIRTLRESASLHELELGKWAKERESYEERISNLEAELSLAEQAHAQLDEQKQENLLLKETIDRMRFDMDEMRNAAATSLASGTGSGQSSATNSLSKSLGAELMGKMKGGWGMDEDEESDDEVTAVDYDDEQTEGEEDVIQTIITKRKRKVASRANRLETLTFEEVKEYSDSSTQYDLDLFTSQFTQTDPSPKVKTISLSTQTESPRIRLFAIQTEPEPSTPPKVTIEMEVQTEEIDDSHSRSPSPQHDESLASSSSTIIPPTPKAHPQQLDTPTDQPPAYNQITSRDHEDRDWHVAAETLKKWHIGAKIPFEPVTGGISVEAAEEWKALKDELGVDCLVIDKIIESSDKISSPRPTKDGKANQTNRRGRFYNIYNTYVYGNKSNPSLTASFAGQAIMVIGVSTLALLAVGPYMVPHYSVPGGPTYYDRSAWNSFNSMQATGEGFSPDGTAAVWNFLGRVGGGAARIARGWPT